ncbi:MAG: adenylosuccinate synthetase [Pirellulaceae bacterium]|nr:adenylosuccinate synthetase [Pirellulaceae bacterium]
MSGTGREAWIVFDLGFGDGGKGATVDFLARECGADLVVRYHGGAQAGHNVVTADGRHHTFSQFGAGTFVPGTRTLLGPDFVLHPGAMLLEARRLRELGVSDALDRTSLDERALVITPFQQAAGRLRELRRHERPHGTCGVGLGETMRDALAGQPDLVRARDLADADRLRDKLCLQRARHLASCERTPLSRSGGELPGSGRRAAAELELLRDLGAVERTLDVFLSVARQLEIHEPRRTRVYLESAGRLIFEGAQGVLLDQDLGFHPHTTWSDCTPRGALRLLEGLPARIVRLGVLRSYMVRHGPGPFPTHDPQWDEIYTEPYNDDHGWQGAFRRGPLDCVLLRYALRASGGADGLVLNCLDQVGPQAAICERYETPAGAIEQLELPASGDLQALERLGQLLSVATPAIRRVPSGELIELLERRLEVPVRLTSTGPTAADRRWRLPLRSS